MFGNATIERNRAIGRNLIGQAVNTGLIAFAGCSIAVAVAHAATTSAGGTRAAAPTSEWRSLLDQRVALATRHDPRMQRLAGTVIAPVGEGWG